jgi:hypothetical protein
VNLWLPCERFWLLQGDGASRLIVGFFEERVVHLGLCVSASACYLEKMSLCTLSIHANDACMVFNSIRRRPRKSGDRRFRPRVS